jgi:hypothetical protein
MVIEAATMDVIEEAIEETIEAATINVIEDGIEEAITVAIEVVEEEVIVAIFRKEVEEFLLLCCALFYNRPAYHFVIEFLNCKQQRVICSDRIKEWWDNRNDRTTDSIESVT